MLLRNELLEGLMRGLSNESTKEWEIYTVS